MRLFVDRKPWNDGISFYLTDSRDGRRFIATDITMEEMPEAAIINASFFLKTIEAQELIDELWQAGLRPSEGTGSAGALAATQKHLEDMRRLVFDGAKPT